MERYLELDEWRIIEKGFNPENQKKSESLFSIGNGRMGQRANFEEKYSGDSLQGSYVGGVYYPDKTRVGWWKNGYPEYFAKVLNSANWIGINISIDGTELDFAKCEVKDFQRILDMKKGILERKARVKFENGKIVDIHVVRFISLVDYEVGAIRYNIVAVNFDGQIKLEPYVDFDIKNEDANYDEKFWQEEKKDCTWKYGYVLAKTKKLDFYVNAGMRTGMDDVHFARVRHIEMTKKEKFVSNILEVAIKKGEKLSLYKYAAVVSSLNCPKDNLVRKVEEILETSYQKGFKKLLEEHVKAWNDIWEECDVSIEGDMAAQQAIRFNIFQLFQTYRGDDERLNIGPKGFTGEKYGGSTYWDTEAYCLPFYLSAAPQKVAKNLLLYRYKHLNKAIENAYKLGFADGAALYPMVTMNGEECHNEWEITFEEIHRNGAIAYAIYNYVNYTGDESYLQEYGLEVLIAISRFWSQRTHFSTVKKKYVILGVTGPNEYENNINNNWYTNKIATWCLKYTREVIQRVKTQNPDAFSKLVERIKFNAQEEIPKWTNIIDNMYFPFDDDNDIILQQEGYMDKEQILAAELDVTERPLNQHWSWDRILRSCFIKQADVIQGLYWFENDFDPDVIKRNFDFYEPRTVHESSLSPCVYSIVASRTGQYNKAYELYLRTARLDLDDYNNEVAEGCHITSMAGTWMTIVQGFGGMRVINGNLSFNPYIPDHWKSYSFNIKYRSRTIKIIVSKQSITVDLLHGDELPIKISGKEYQFTEKRKIEIRMT